MSTLSRLRAQVAEERNADAQNQRFTTVEEIRNFIREAPNSTTINAHLCAYESEAFGKGWHVSFIDKDLSNDFENAKMLLEQLPYHQKSFYLFTLTVWKPKRPGTDVPRFEPGQVYELKRVKHLKMYYNNPQGALDANR